MYIVTSYGVAVFLCVVTMLCWGSWANTQKLTGKGWPFQLFYWDYAIGVFLFSLAFAFTLGSRGDGGRGFMADLAQADSHWLWSAFIGGVVFNLSNILLVAAIDIAGMAVAFPVGVGLALVLGVISTYVVKPEGNVALLGVGVAAVVVAIVIDAVAYRRLASGSNQKSGKGIVLSILAGVLMGFFYSFVARSIGTIILTRSGAILEEGKLSPYTAIVLFSVGVLLSNFLWNSLVMAKPFAGPPVPFGDYFRKGSAKTHLVGILGGAIWNCGMSLNILSGSRAGPALSYGLGQGATMIGALWGVFIWREFKNAPAGTGKLLAAMFLFYLAGLATLVCSRS